MNESKKPDAELRESPSDEIDKIDKKINLISQQIDLYLKMFNNLHARIENYNKTNIRIWN
jgi:hypothetical protein